MSKANKIARFFGAAASESPVGVGLRVLEKIFDRFAVRRKMTEAERESHWADMQMAAASLDSADKAELHDFIIEYEGRAADQNWFIQTVRGLIRPVLTVYVIVMNHVHVYQWLTMQGEASERFMTVLKFDFFLSLLVLGFWFGDRVIQRLGVADFIRGKVK